MTDVLTLSGMALMAVGTAFLVVAAVGFWRLPDIYSRLHALTKADTAGLALIALGAALVERDARIALTLGLVVVLVAISGATAGHLVARSQLAREEEAR